MSLRLILIVSLLATVAFACSDAAEQGKTTATAQQPQAIVFSTQVGVTELRSANNWCILPFEEAIVINAESTNLNRRYFAVGEGLYKVVVRRGNTAAPFMVRRKGASLEVFTSDQFPTCLARKNYFTIIEDGRTLLHLNPPYYEFRLESEPWQNALKVTIEFPVGSEYGLIVHRQKDVE